MFEFVQSRNIKLKPTRLVYISRIASFFAHVAIIALLIRFPELLEGGKFHQFHPLSIFYNMLRPQSEKPEDQKWRTVAVLTPKMQMPPPEVLKKLLKDNLKKGEEPKSPKIEIRWGDEQKAALASLANKPIRPPDQRPSKAAPPPIEAASNTDTNANGNNGRAEIKPTTTATTPTTPVAQTIQLPPATPNKDAMTIPAPAIKSDSVKTATADVSKPPDAAPKTNPELKTFKDEQAALASSGSGFFGTEGFPLGEYAAQLKPIIEGNFEIPNYLAHAKGKMTAVFYINDKGMLENAHIVTRSGNDRLDIQALIAIKNSAPFPWPKGYPGNRIGVKYVFVYNQ